MLEYLTKRIPVPVRDFTSPPQMIVIRSFDVNRPGCEVDDVKGGIAGGSILQGVLKHGQEIEIRPGIVTKDSTGALKCVPIFSRIVSLFAETNPLQFAVPGGLIGVGTSVDPTLTRADRLVGQVLGQVRGARLRGRRCFFGFSWGKVEEFRICTFVFGVRDAIGAQISLCGCC